MSRAKATELRVKLLSRARLPETSKVSMTSLKVTWNVRQGIKPDSLLPRDPKTSSGVLQELNKAAAF